MEAMQLWCGGNIRAAATSKFQSRGHSPRFMHSVSRCSVFRIAVFTMKLITYYLLWINIGERGRERERKRMRIAQGYAYRETDLGKRGARFSLSTWRNEFAILNKNRHVAVYLSPLEHYYSLCLARARARMSRFEPRDKNARQNFVL